MLASAILLSIGSGCSRPPARPVERIAILPFENLTGTAALDWLSPAAAAVLEGQLAASRTVRVFPVQSLSDAYAGGATEVVHGYFSPERAEQVRVHVTVEDLGHLRTAKEYVAVAGAAQFLALMNGVAHDLDAAARPYATRSLEALRAFAESGTTRDPAAAVKMLEQALAADADFGPAYVALVQRLASAGDARAKAVAELGIARKLDEVDRLRLRAMVAGLSGDSAAQVNALTALADASPADVNLLLGVADNAFRARRFPEAAVAYRKAAAADPSRAGTWNLLAYSQAYSGDLNGALQSLEKYRALAPKDPNRLDSLGDINLLFGRFAEAEKAYLEANAADPAFLNGGPLAKAATVRWMAGDLSRADALAGKYLDGRRAAHDPLAAYREAQWKFLTGRHEVAISALNAALPGMQGDAAALIRSELALWQLDAGDRAAAQRAADLAVTGAASPQIKVLGWIAKFAASNATAPEVTTLVRQAIPAEPPTLRDQVLAWALLFRNRFAEAEPLFAGLEKQTAPDAVPRLALLRAWALVKAGRVQEAAPLAANYPVPAAAGEAPFAVLIVPRWFFVKAMVLREQGKTTEAEELMKLYRQYAGSGAFAKDDLAQWDRAAAKTAAR